jgi:gp16 family phage-associated protein
MTALPPNRCLICGRENFLCSDLASPLKSHAEAKAAFHWHGIAIKQWAADHKVHFNSVNEVVGGRKRCIRGDAHAIAVLLRLKNGDINEFTNSRGKDPFASEIAQ